MMHELRDDRFGLQIIVAVVVVAFIAYGAVEALHDAVRFGVARAAASPTDSGRYREPKTYSPNPLAARRSTCDLRVWISVVGSSPLLAG